MKVQYKLFFVLFGEMIAIRAPLGTFVKAKTCGGLIWQNKVKQSWTKRTAEALELELEDSDDDDETSVKMPMEKRELMKVQSLQQVNSLLWFRFPLIQAPRV
jgi:hypothetical protein